MNDPPETQDGASALPPDAATALAHLYRGELGRMISYRRRLDTTTNWAISFVGAAVSLTIGSDGVPHTVLLAAMLLVLVFLILEARRFRHYEASRARVQILERGYFPGLLQRGSDYVWVDLLVEHLRDPRPPLDTLTAIGWRLRRNYLWIYLAAAMCWLLKLELAGAPADGPAVLVSRAGVGPLPGMLIVLAVLGFYIGLITLAVFAARGYPLGEDW